MTALSKLLHMRRRSLYELTQHKGAFNLSQSILNMFWQTRWCVAIKRLVQTPIQLSGFTLHGSKWALWGIAVDPQCWRTERRVQFADIRSWVVSRFHFFFLIRATEPVADQLTFKKLHLLFILRKLSAHRLRRGFERARRLRTPHSPCTVSYTISGARTRLQPFDSPLDNTFKQHYHRWVTCK